MNKVQESLVGDYSDNNFLKDLEALLGSEEELDRLNKHRTQFGNPPLTQEELDEVIRAAIKIRAAYEGGPAYVSLEKRVAKLERALRVVSSHLLFTGDRDRHETIKRILEEED
jgi:hypothetical protein